MFGAEPPAIWRSSQTLIAILVYGSLFVCVLAEVPFPPQFYVSTGTTIPLLTAEPTTQSGAIYVDQSQGLLRIDTFWMGNRRAVIIHRNESRGYVTHNGVCTTLQLTGGISFFSIPSHATRHAESYSVRGVPVTRFSTSELGETLYKVDYYVRLKNESINGESVADPWRIVYQRSQRPEIAAAPLRRDQPNWRYFGQPMDEIIRYGNTETSIASLVDDVPVMIDFFDFFPSAPDINVFTIPAACGEPPTSSFDFEVDVVDVHMAITELGFCGSEKWHAGEQVKENVKDLF